jgi:hypothetical protein
MAKTDDYSINYKHILVRLSDGSSIRGNVNLGDYKRLSDLVKHSTDKFITVVSEGTSEEPIKVFLVNKDYMIWAEAED